MKILFMGTPEFAVPSLAQLCMAGHEICGVFTQPDKPKNRGMKLQASPVKEYAIAHNISVYQPQKLRDGEAMNQIRALNPELIVVAAYGRLLPDDILAYPTKGCINVHSSLLPKYRGAAPINWAILNGDTETGVTIMYMASELDAGDLIAQDSTPIAAHETAPDLFARLSIMGAALLVTVVKKINAGIAPRMVQDDTQVTYAPMLSRALSPIDWTQSATMLHAKVRGLIPWPNAVADFGGVRCKLWNTTVLEQTSELPPGTVAVAGKNGIVMVCGGGTLLCIVELQCDGGKRMKAADYLRGHPLDTII